jgi:hypothetical protein
MNEEGDYPKIKRSGLNKKWAILGGFALFLILVGFGALAVVRPVIVMDTGRAGIHVRNTGRMDALIYRVDGFWYWAGQVALLANMPGIHQRVAPGADPVRLQIPDIPIPVEQAAQQTPVFMKLTVRYGIPGIPVFRYTRLLYFEYNPTLKAWATTQSIPPKYRALGNLTIGNVGQIKLNFD